MKSITIEVPGKWVLSGEHAVIRGARALALPHPEARLRLDWQAAPRWDFEIQPVEVDSIVRSMLSEVEKRSGVDLISRLEGRLSLKSSIPLGAGFGSSAALCVGVVRWLNETALSGMRVPELDFATRLEDAFHGKSSGMDIAAVASGRPICFQRGREARLLDLKRLPVFTFHDTGRRAATRACVEQVESLEVREASRFQEIDRRMDQATGFALEALESYQLGVDRVGALEALSDAMELGQSCFRDWDLMPLGAQKKIDELKGQGALAVKLTGAGLGGFLVALWEDERDR